MKPYGGTNGKVLFFQHGFSFVFLKTTASHRKHYLQTVRSLSRFCPYVNTGIITPTAYSKYNMTMRIITFPHIIQDTKPIPRVKLCFYYYSWVFEYYLTVVQIHLLFLSSWYTNV